jgi:RNA polymerase subunit RPABC4/transcription elongation factor Spt4
MDWGFKMFCPQCGKDIKDGAKFCGNCGWAVPNAPVQNAQPAEQRCTSCGTVLKEGARFCPNCGTAVNSAFPQTNTAPASDGASNSPESTSPMLIIVKKILNEILDSIPFIFLSLVTMTWFVHLLLSGYRFEGIWNWVFFLLTCIPAGVPVFALGDELGKWIRKKIEKGNQKAVPVQQIAAGTSTTENTGMNKLIFTAAIVAAGFWYLLLALLLEDVNFSIENILSDHELVVLSFLLVLSPISIILSFSGWKKNNRKMVLTAGILYIVSIYGIPSGIMCIIVYRKMKKR